MKIKLFLSIISIISYLFIVFYAPLHIAEMEEMKMPMENCPFASAEHSLCTMTIGDHLRNWNSWLSIKVSSLNVFGLLSVVYISLTAFLYAPKILSQLFYYKRQRKKKIFVLLDHLFSIGVFNSKVPIQFNFV
jgi:hypothetical protein